ncbi:hypothetical protein OCU04_006560 [Sclerotinia nivalis]|uniref:Uncharacterized protein n=1 Tax=Sclerotinia nivalis TaxID=352851 RepID=A0A9X0AK19_9HELO|nr:hypothetical protein OCU04_006560 [Sclerotinia nivalis]
MLVVTWTDESIQMVGPTFQYNLGWQIVGKFSFTSPFTPPFTSPLNSPSITFAIIIIRYRQEIGWLHYLLFPPTFFFYARSNKFMHLPAYNLLPIYKSLHLSSS